MAKKTIETVEQIGPAAAWLVRCLQKGLEGGPVDMTVERHEDARTLDQNAKLWAMCTDVSRQVLWYGERPSPEDWKQIFSAAWKQQKTFIGINGGFVVCGVSTRKIVKRDFCDLIEIIYAFGAEHGVKWSEPSLQTFSQYREAA